MSMLDTAKKHPLLLGGVAVGGLLLILAMRSSGGSVVASTNGGQGAADANGIQAQQMAINGQVQLAGIGAAVQSEAISADLEKSNIAANSTNAANVLAAAIATKNLDLSHDLAVTQTTLGATYATNKLLSDNQLQHENLNNQYYANYYQNVAIQQLIAQRG
jgi:hypothetical protein